MLWCQPFKPYNENNFLLSILPGDNSTSGYIIAGQALRLTFELRRSRESSLRRRWVIRGREVDGAKRHVETVSMRHSLLYREKKTEELE